MLSHAWLALNLIAGNFGWKSRRTFLTSRVHVWPVVVNGGGTKEKPARSVSFYLHDLDKNRPDIQWGEASAPESAIADANSEAWCLLFTVLTEADRLSLTRQPSLAVHAPGALTFLARLFDSIGDAFLQPFDELHWRHAASCAEVERFQKIHSPLAKLGLGDKGLRFAELLSQGRLIESSFFPDLTQQRPEPSVSR